MSVTKHNPIERAERFVSFGAVTCDICRDIDRKERSDAAEFWPDEPVSFLNADADPAVDFWSLTVCDHHDTFDRVPDDATHMARFETFRLEDHNMNSAVGREAIEVQEL